MYTASSGEHKPFFIRSICLCFIFAVNLSMTSSSGSRLIAVYNGEAGGTRNTLKYAKNRDVEIVVIEG